MLIKYVSLCLFQKFLLLLISPFSLICDTLSLAPVNPSHFFLSSICHICVLLFPHSIAPWVSAFQSTNAAVPCTSLYCAD